jgi:hypothetical protein
VKQAGTRSAPEVGHSLAGAEMAEDDAITDRKIAVRCRLISIVVLDTVAKVFGFDPRSLLEPVHSGKRLVQSDTILV